MLEAARKIARFTSGHRSAEDLLANESDFWSVVHMLEVIGEAAAHVSPATRAMLPLPWVESVATRNRLAHGYFDINALVIWRTATQDVPLLANALETFFDRESTGESEP
jgi:uncharacterized protein with HEPN domain